MQEIAIRPAEMLVAVDDEARLAHALRLVRGFALFFVRCNVPLYRAEVVARLKAALPRPIGEVDLAGEPEVYPAVARAAESLPDDGLLFAYGLEAHLPSSDREQALQTLRGLNWRRAAFQRLERPLVFWLPEYALNLIARESPDFYDWNSGVFELTVPEPLRDALLLEAVQIPEAEAFLSLPAKQKESRVQLLEGLWEEYGETRPAEQRARLRLALQLGGLSFALGRYEEARRWLGEAERLARALGDQAGVAGTLHQLGMLAQSRRDLEGAMGLYRESLAIAESLGDLRGKATTLHNMAHILALWGNLAEAMGLLRESLAIAESLGDLQGKATTLHAMAEILRVRGDPEGAMELYRESLAIRESLGDLRGKAATLDAMAYILRMRGDLEGAMELYRQSLAIRESLGDRRGKGMTLAMMGQVLLAQGEALEGVRALRQAREILVGMGARADAEWVEETLAWARQMLETEQGTNARITNQKPRITPAR